MAVATSSALVDTLEQIQLLTPEQLEEVKTALVPKHGEAKALAQELVNRKWITVFQGKQLLMGYGKSLILGSYLLLDRVGKGGVGQVFKAKHRYMNRIVAVKTLHPDAFKDKEAMQRFRREIEVASQLAHPNIVHAYEAGPIGSVLALILEYAEGINLNQLVDKQGPLPVRQACEYIRQAATGLQYAHERGFIHRDIKPANLLVTKSGPKTALEVVKILDMGLARAQEPVEGSQTHHLTVLGGSTVMQGTPDYMAPEQAIDFHTADIRSDIYSLGCTLFHLLAGHPPFPAGTLAERLMRHQQSEVPIDGLRPDVTPELADVVRQMMAKQPDDRYQTPGEVAEALAPFCKAGDQSSESVRPTESMKATETVSVDPFATMVEENVEETPASIPTQKMPLNAKLTPPRHSQLDPAPRSSRTVLLVAGGVGVAALTGALLLFLSGNKTEEKTSKQVVQTQTTQTTKTTPEVPKTRVTVIDLAKGFPGGSVKINGAGSLKDNHLRLVELKNDQRATAFFPNKVDVQSFATEFTFKITKPEADGFTFIIQNQGNNAVGEHGGGLGYKGIQKSVAIKFDIWGSDGEDNSTGLYLKGATPDKPFRKLGGNVSLKSEHVLKARLEYEGRTLKLTLTDTETNATHSETFDVDIPAAVQGTKAYVGFGAASGGKNALYEILTWTYQQG